MTFHLSGDMHIESGVICRHSALVLKQNLTGVFGFYRQVLYWLDFVYHIINDLV